MDDEQAPTRHATLIPKFGCDIAIGFTSPGRTISF